MFGFLHKKKEIPDEPEVTVVSPGERRIYIFDFDRTITILHTGAIAYGDERTPEFIHKNVKKGFADFVRRVVSRGHKVYIASYSDDGNAALVEEDAISGHDLIKFYMDQIFGPEQTLFTIPQKNTAGETVSVGNIVASNSQDNKQFHLDFILHQEGLDQGNPDDMKRVYILEDDEDVVRSFMEKGCTVIVPFSASRSADTAATRTLFTSYMPESFKA
ncbi:MAG: hypothetical protein ACWGN1_00690 [Desulfobulbales bacterium]